MIAGARMTGQATTWPAAAPCLARIDADVGFTMAP